MYFNQYNLLWLCFFALIPWLIYLLQLLFGKTRPLPSLIFIQEYRKKKIRRNRKFLIYFLQSLLLFCGGLLISQPSLTVKKEGNFCLVDDLVHSQWNLEKWSKIKSQAKAYCRQGFHSLSSFASNKIELVNENKMDRSNEVLLQNVFVLLNEKLKNEKKLKQIIFIVPENNYDEKDFAILTNKIKVIPFKVKDKKNLYFKKIEVSLNPLDFRKRDMLIVGNDLAAGKTVIIEKGESKFSVELDESSTINMSLDVNFNKKFEPIIVTIQGDNYINDNQYFSSIQSKQPAKLSIARSSAIPMRVLRAALLLNEASFPYQWFSKKRRPGSLSIKLEEFSQTKMIEKNTIYIAHSQVPSVRFLQHQKKNFKDYYLRNTLDVSRLSIDGYNVVARFSDNLPAVIKWPRVHSGFFLFDPDSAQKELMLTPNYPIYLLNAMLKIIYSNSRETLTKDEKNSVGFFFTIKNKLVKSVNEFYGLQGNDSTMENMVIGNFQTSSLLLNNNEFPSQMKIKFNNKSVGVDVRNIFYLLLTLLLLAIFMLETPSFKKK